MAASAPTAGDHAAASGRHGRAWATAFAAFVLARQAFIFIAYRHELRGLRVLWPAGRRVVDALVFMTGCTVYLAAVSSIAELSENRRFRVAVERLIWIVCSVFLAVGFALVSQRLRRPRTAHATALRKFFGSLLDPPPAVAVHDAATLLAGADCRRLVARSWFDNTLPDGVTP